MKLTDYKQAPYNPRQITEDQFRMLKGSIDAFGDLSGIIINTKTNHIVGGNQRVKAFLEMAIEQSITQTETFDPPTEKGTIAVGYCTLSDGE